MDYLEQLVQDIRAMKPRSKLFIVLKEELNKKGYWKNHKRGSTAASKRAYQHMLKVMDKDSGWF